MSCAIILGLDYGSLYKFLINMASRNVCQVFVQKLVALYINYEVKVEFFTLEVDFVPSLSIQLLSNKDSYEKLNRFHSTGG